MSQASKLLGAAGWKRQGNLLVNDKGEGLTVESSIEDESFVRVDSPWVENMRAIGIDASIRQVEFGAIRGAASEFRFRPDRRWRSRFRRRRPATRSTACSIRAPRQCRARNNLPGTVDPAVDALIDAVGAAENRDDLTVAMRALDRVLRARMDWIPNWYSANHMAAFWDMFGFKEPKPDFGFPVEALWWFDEDKAKAIGKG